MTISTKSVLLKKDRLLELKQTSQQKPEERKLMDFLKNSAKTEQAFKLEKELEEMDEEIEQNKSKLKRGF